MIALGVSVVLDMGYPSSARGNAIMRGRMMMVHVEEQSSMRNAIMVGRTMVPVVDNRQLVDRGSAYGGLFVDLEIEYARFYRNGQSFATKYLQKIGTRNNVFQFYVLQIADYEQRYREGCTCMERKCDS